MSANVAAFDAWIRTTFVELNTELEELYWARADRADTEGVGDDLKQRLLEEGRTHVRALAAEGNTDEGFDQAFDLLGNLGLYMGALRRHELTNPAREQRSPHVEASTLGLHIGASLGMVPRFTSSHLGTHNRAVAGLHKSFTSLHDEFLFVDMNTRGILATMRAADALRRIVPLGITHPVAVTLLDDARRALEDVAAFNEALFSDLDRDRFFYSVRPYYKPYRVGRQEYRGANAGDFSGINEIDLLLGLCRGEDPYYAQLLVDKMQFMLPADQASLRDCLRRRSFLDELLDAAGDGAGAPWFTGPARAFLAVCDAHGRVAAQHHDQLVARFIEEPATRLEQGHLAQVTASGPPLPVLIAALETLRDLRQAAPRTDIASRHADIERLRAAAAVPPAPAG